MNEIDGFDDNTVIKIKVFMKYFYYVRFNLFWLTS